MTDFQNARSALVARLDALGAVAGELGEPTAARTAEELADGLRANRFTVAVAGAFKNGKSTLLNALLGRAILPMDVVESSAAIVEVRYGDRERAEVRYREGPPREIAVEQVAGLASVENEGVADVERVVVELPLDLLRDGVVLVDTPGILSGVSARGQVTIDYISRADAVLVVMNAEHLLQKAEHDFVKAHVVPRDKARVFFVVNHIDLVEGEEDVPAFVERFRARVADLVRSPEAFPLCAIDALDGVVEGSPELVERSGLPRLREALRGYLLDERGADLLAAYERRAASLRNDLLCAVNVRRRSGEIGEEELDRKLEMLRPIIDRTRQDVAALKTDLTASFSALEAAAKTEADGWLASQRSGLELQVESTGGLDMPAFQHELRGFSERIAERIVAQSDAIRARIVSMLDGFSIEVDRTLTRELQLAPVPPAPIQASDLALTVVSRAAPDPAGGGDGSAERGQLLGGGLGLVAGVLLGGFLGGAIVVLGALLAIDAYDKTAKRGAASGPAERPPVTHNLGQVFEGLRARFGRHIEETVALNRRQLESMIERAVVLRLGEYEERLESLRRARGSGHSDRAMLAAAEERLERLG